MTLSHETTILIAEDDATSAHAVRTILKKNGYTIPETILSGEEAIIAASRLKPQAILMDIMLSGPMDGIEAAKIIQTEHNIPVILVTSHFDSELLKRIRSVQPYGYIQKPVNSNELITAIEIAIYKHAADRRTRESEKKYRELIERINDIIYATDENGIMTFISPRMHELYNYRLEEIVGHHISDFVFEDDLPVVVEGFNSMDISKKVSGEFRIITKTGDLIWFRFSSRPVFINGRFDGVRGVLTDITSEKKTEAKLQRSEYLLNRMLEAVPDLLSIHRKDYTIAYSNWKLLEDLPGKDHTVGSKCYNAYFARDDVCEGCRMKEVFITGESYRGQIQLRKNTWIDLSIIPLLGKDGNPDMVVELVRDISCLKKTEEKLQINNEELQATIEELEATNEEFEAQNEEIINAHTELEKNESILKGILRAVPAGIGITHNRVLGWMNPGLLEMTGYNAEELSGINSRIFYHDDAEYDRVGREKYMQIHATGIGTLETLWQKKDGSLINVLLSSAQINPSDSNESIIFSATDITARKLSESMLKESEKRYHALFQENHSVMLIMDPDSGDIVDANEAACSFYGYTHEELTSMKATDINMLTDQKIHENMIKAKTGSLRQFMFRHRLSSGEIRDVEVYSGSIIFSGKKHLYSIVHDITKRKKAEKQLTSSLMEKEMLLKEIHHRVKNNLQIISSLLFLQSDHLSDKKDRELLNTSQNRIQSMGLVHEMLYQSDNIAEIDFSSYLEKLVEQLARSFPIDTDGISTLIEADNIFLDINTAIPCALLINELVSNSFKHAFKGTDSGLVTIRMVEEDGRYLLTVKDTGIGLASDLNIQHSDTLGLKLVYALAEQLKGSISFETGTGTTFTLSIPIKSRDRHTD